MDANARNESNLPSGSGPTGSTPPTSPSPGPDAREPARPPRTALDQMLRGPELLLARLDGPGSTGLIASLALIACLGFAIYGVVMGSFSGGALWWVAPTKVVIGAAVCAGICFPP